MNEKEMPEDLRTVVAFHGHMCPGLAIGYRAAKAAAAKLGLKRDKDEELVAVVENDACGVDAFQVLLGCSLGKGNLIFRDQGKHAFTVFRRDTGAAVRIVYTGGSGGDTPEGTALRRKVFAGTATPEEMAMFEENKHQRIRELLTAPLDEIFAFKQPAFGVPERARVFISHPCEACGEMTMEPRLRLVDGRKLCLDCSQPYHRGW